MNTKTFTTFTENQVQTKLEKLIELEKQAKAINLQIDIIKDELKQNMDDNGLEKLNGNTLYCFYKDVVKNIIDNDKLKADNLYNYYLKQTEYKMFKHDSIK